MQINPVNQIAALQYARVQAAGGKEKSESVSVLDSIELSDQAKLFSDALNAAKKNAAEEAGSVDKQARIQQIVEQLRTDSYEIDTDALCASMLSNL